MIRAILDFHFPQYGFLGEEGGTSGNTERLWIVDPLEGTLNFVQGFPHWCVSVALWDSEGAVVGCVLDPLRGDEFVAVRGLGATWNGRPMRVSAHPGLDSAFLAVGFAYQLGDRFPASSAPSNASSTGPRACGAPAPPPWTWPTPPPASSTAISSWASRSGTSPPAPCW